ncbi:oxidative stress-responsive serine-rich protein 1 [Boleophthalmus pectinirostris]|uniref:oxidative stress-responsive serine-rich protein 1 n=1 Tax=Boleophthalmus pectinirostris TaxID=150288 RepID=UPI000A1C3136|nr:oxidative stress-responsive serine-rich protein 1 [Boleophthalmus pectinirostris]
MEAGGKECEEETLQTAFKKLRVDAESLSGGVSASEAVTPRSASRACLDTNGAKPKLVCQKDNWHGCTRKTSRGASRTQRRRRSKSPILQPAKFTYCSSATASALSPPSGCLKQQLLACLEPSEPGPSVEGETLSLVAQKEPSSLHAQSHISALIFGTSAAYDTPPGASASLQKTIPAINVLSDVQTSDESRMERSACDGAESGPPQAEAQASDFRALSELSTSCGSPAQCSCIHKKCVDTPKGNAENNVHEPKCCCLPNNPTSWNDVEVYSFTGLRNVVTECERATLSPEDSQRTVSTNSNLTATSSGSPRSCSEQARAYVDDITIEDLSGYLEYYLYIPKKMSHMAEMMYT